MDALTRRILEHVREHPGCTTEDVLASLPSRYSRDTAWYRIVHLRSTYEIDNLGGAGRPEDVKWHILEWEPTAFFLEFASDLLKELKDLPPRKKKSFLARRLQEAHEDLFKGES